MNDEFSRLIVVSNRLPVALAKVDEQWTIQPGAGGLVTALAPVLRNRGGVWIGWSGAHVEEDLGGLFDSFAKKSGYSLVPVDLDKKEIELYYQGFSNEVIWPLFHDFQSRCRFLPEYYTCYKHVNNKFAEAVAAVARPKDYIWVHDYHLMNVGTRLKEMGLKQQLGFFLHIPFPSLDIFLTLPWRRQILRALLDFDLVGFQTMRDRKNFVRCVQALMPEIKFSGRGGIVRALDGERNVRVGAFPISIDFKAFAGIAAQKNVEEQGHEIKKVQRGRKIILGVDRLDYSKGIPQRLQAVRNALKRYPELQNRIHFIQVVVPSREAVGEYQDLKTEIETLVSQINGEFSTADWIPVHYHYRNLNREELVAYYRAADMALITPLKDGMNLVAKEYCASKVRVTGTLILSEFAGVAAQLKRYGAYLVNPNDVEGVADAIYHCFHESDAETRHRMGKMRAFIKKYNINWWLDSFLMGAFSKHLRDFPTTESETY